MFAMLKANLKAKKRFLSILTPHERRQWRLRGHIWVKRNSPHFYSRTQYMLLRPGHAPLWAAAIETGETVGRAVAFNCCIVYTRRMPQYDKMITLYLYFKESGEQFFGTRANPGAAHSIVKGSRCAWKWDGDGRSLPSLPRELANRLNVE